jgi:hypothetical protein|tara:strand:- start:592 stop:765 length:174 start_codon:yes stop_codon:yes gene_type:complete
MTLDIDPQPTDEEMAAILVAYEALWPRPSAATEPESPSRWRFAGRPWTSRAGYGGWR